MSRFLLMSLVFLAALGCDDDDASPAPDATPPDATTDGSADGPPLDGPIPDVAWPDVGLSADAAPDASADAADADAGPDAEPPVAWYYAPATSPTLDAFPDDFWAVEGESPTGQVLSVADAPWRQAVAPFLKDTFMALEGMSGFSTNGGLYLRFDGRLGALPTVEDSVQNEAISLIDLETNLPAHLPYLARLEDGDATLVIEPLYPLRRGGRFALVVTTAQTDAAGRPLAPSPWLADRLAEDAPDPLTERLRVTLETQRLTPDRVAAVTVFTTHDDLAVLPEVAADIRGRTYTWSSRPTCQDQGEYWACEGRFSALDYRDGPFIRDAVPGEPWELPVSLWLPKGDGPFPVVVYGHGIDSRRENGARLATVICPLGLSVVAIDAMAHGSHPTRNPRSGIATMDFLGVVLNPLSLDARILRGNVEQTIADRLQLLSLLRQAPDLDGDGDAELDASRLAYYGFSLGGMLGPQLLAYDDGFSAAMLTVAGGHLMRFVSDNGQVAPFRPALARLVGGDGELTRLLLAAQTLVDPADPCTFGPLVQSARLDAGASAPDLLFPMVIQDQTVPATSTAALARALGVSIMAGGPLNIPGLPVAPEAPFVGNRQGVTSALFQHDRETTPSGVVPTTHDSMPVGPEGVHQIRRFFEAWRDGQGGLAVDPYQELGTPPLP